MSRYVKVASAISGGTGRIFRGIFKLRILFIFLAFILINAIILGIQAGSVEVVIKDLGNRFLTPTLALQQTSSYIINNQGLYTPTDSSFSNLFTIISNIFDILTHFYIIILWVALLSIIIRHLILWDSSKVAVAYVIAFIFFIGIQMILLSFNNEAEMMTPIYSFRDFFLSLPYIISPISQISEDIMGQQTKNITELLNETA